MGKHTKTNKTNTKSMTSIKTTPKLSRIAQNQKLHPNQKDPESNACKSKTKTKSQKNPKPSLKNLMTKNTKKTSKILKIKLLHTKPPSKNTKKKSKTKKSVTTPKSNS